MPVTPKFQAWPKQSKDLSLDELIQHYNNGFIGAGEDPKAKEAFRQYLYDSGGTPIGEDIAHQYGLADSAAGKLVASWMHIEKLFPGALPGPAQTIGDCVSHSTKNANLMTMSCEIVAAKPDEVTGVIEGIPEISPEGIANGVLSTESVYWWRRHGGDGWSCPDAAQVVLKESGCCWPRTNYPDLGIDVTKYSSSVAHKYGSQTPPENFKKQGGLHLIRSATELNSFEQIRDFLYNGFGVSSCGSEGYSNKRDENGVSKRSGSWAHALAIVGADDRDIIKQIYGEPLINILNSWKFWNSGPTLVKGTNINIFQGSFWTPWSQAKNRYYVAFAGVNGWKPKLLPSYGAEQFL